MPMGKKSYAGGAGMMGMKGMKDGSRNAMQTMNMNGRIDPGMTPSMSQTKPATKMGGPMGGQIKGSMGDAARGKMRRGGGY